MCDRRLAAPAHVAPAQAPVHIFLRRRRAIAPGRQRRQRGSSRMPQGRKRRFGRSLRRKSDGTVPGDVPKESDRPDLPDEPQTPLREKYQQLSRKYHALLRKYLVTAGERTGVYRLGWWALKTSDSALAL